MNEERNLSVAMRPSKLDECIGNSKIIAQIKSQLKSGRVPTAFLLAGPTGIGKTTLARCITNELDGELIETNAADDTGIDTARRLGEEAQHRSLLGNYKVLVLDEAQQLTKQAQNALLKHVEDTAPSTLWIFGTTEVSKIIPALKGRCISYTLSGLMPEQIKALVYRGIQYLGTGTNKTTADIEGLIRTLAEENITSPRAILMAIERFAGGMEPLGAILGSQDTPIAFEIARAAFKKEWLVVSKLLSQLSNDEAMTARIVIVNYFKSALLKGTSDTNFCSEAIIRLTASIPFDGPLCLAELSSRLFQICQYKRSN